LNSCIFLLKDMNKSLKLYKESSCCETMTLEALEIKKEELENDIKNLKLQLVKIEEERILKLGVIPTKAKRHYKQLLSAAKYRNLECNLTFGQFVELYLKPCFYCHRPQKGSGYCIDRIDNSLGYIAGNCCSCCARCNIFKGDAHIESFYYSILEI